MPFSSRAPISTLQTVLRGRAPPSCSFSSSPSIAPSVSGLRLRLTHVYSTIAGVSERDIGIISPFRLQLAAIEAQLAKCGRKAVEVCTVDRYQGRDKEVILLSLVRNNTECKIGDLLSDFRRINVAVSRPFIPLRNAPLLPPFPSPPLSLPCLSRFPSLSISACLHFPASPYTTCGHLQLVCLHVANRDIHADLWESCYTRGRYCDMASCRSRERGAS